MTDPALTRRLQASPVLVVGAGIMGAGIAQVAAQAGHRVWLHDARPGAAEAAMAKLAETLRGLAAKGKLTPEAAEATIGRLRAASSPQDAAADGALLAIEAIVEDLGAKRALLAELEGALGAEAVLATNTSSISVTALANGLQRPERLVGMHFFNPVPLMKLVEVVHGLRTEAAVADAIFALAEGWGKTAVHARSTPGFIVNRIARPFYAETWALLQEQAATPEVIDACLQAAGFRMGPCALMDLIGHDTNLAVTRSVYDANFQDKRYQPALLQQEMVAGGLLGRKSGQGFYRYPEGPAALPVAVPPTPADVGQLVVHGRGPAADALHAGATRALAAQGWGPGREPDGGWTGLRLDGGLLVLTDGRPAHAVAQALGHRDVAVFDRWSGPLAPTGHALAYSVHAGASAAFAAQVPAWLAALGFTPLRVADAPGLIVARTQAMLINEAADAVQQGVCSSEAADAAMKLGVNYPAGPFEWLEGWSIPGVLGVLDALDATYRGERYRASPWLLRRATAAHDRSVWTAQP